jgi:plasmid stabilization system protein ParE
VSYRVVFRPQSQAELLEARDWYEVRQKGLGVEFSAAVDATVSNISEQPLVYPRVHNEIRRAILQRFPYAVFFQLLENEIVILAVTHGRRHPSTWQSRR